MTTLAIGKVFTFFYLKLAKIILKVNPLEPNTHYHIFNRANGSEKIFQNSGNYRFFLRKYKKHILPICDTFCYCLMPNHFHLLVRIKDEKAIKTLENFRSEQIVPTFLSKQFSNLFSSYTQALNKQIGRKGNLFMRPFKRKPIENTAYLQKLVHYIHLNPVKAGLCNYPKDWEHSSYEALISDKPTFLHQKEILNYFDGLENFKYVHSRF